jgi:hypothetical protein
VNAQITELLADLTEAETASDAVQEKNGSHGGRRNALDRLVEGYKITYLTGIVLCSIRTRRAS